MPIGKTVNEFSRISPGSQRLFRDTNNNYILLHKAGIAISFWLQEDGSVRVSERLDGVDFKATGTQLRNEGWKCLGPGMDYAWLLTQKHES